MAKERRELMEVGCPCGNTWIEIEQKLRAGIRHKEVKKPPPIEAMGAAVQKLKGEEARRAEVFQKSFDEHKSHAQVLERKFDELLKQAKENPDELPAPRRPFDYE